MADFTQIIQEINEDITTNGVGAITGAKLNEVLRDMIAAVNAEKEDLVQNGYIYGGKVNPNSTPSADKRLFYIAEQEGTYTNFGGLYVTGTSIFIIKWNENTQNWTIENFGITYDGVDIEITQRFRMLYLELGFDSFSPSTSYTIGDYVTKVDIGGLYRFNSNHPAGQWDEDDVVEVTLLDYIDDLFNGKADKVSGATNGNLAGLDADGNLTDSGIAASDVVTSSDLATVATSGSYNDLLNKPTIPAAQVNSDWNANSGVAQILNKPTIPAAQIQSDWNEADNTKVDYIKNKPTIPDVSGKADKVVGAVSGDVATLDGNGNLTDSGLSVFDFFVMVEDVSTPPASMTPNTVYQYGTLSGNTTFPPLATPTEPDIANVYCWTFTTPATAPTITWPSAITSWAGGSAPTINASKSYEVSVMDGFATIIEN